MAAALSSSADGVTHPWVAEGRRRLRFGLGIVGREPTWSEYVQKAQQAEALGFDGIWVQDHPRHWPDCFTTLTTIALQTSTIRLGTIVCCVYYRHPLLLARLAADLDHVSQGRLVLGLGMGYVEPEFAALGMTLPPIRDRQQALEESIQIIQGVWGSELFTLHGQHFQTEATAIRPPIQTPSVPILIAGGGERVTLRQVAQYGDAANFGPNPATGGAASLEDVRRKCQALRQHCETVGRSYDTVLRSHVVWPILASTREAALAKVETFAAYYRPGTRSTVFMDTPQAMVAYYQGLAEAGMRYFIVALHTDDEETLRLIGEEVIPALASAPVS